MSDWNPAEIIGNPKKLSSSIYSKLVTDKGKKEKNRDKIKKLMSLYSGKPYIDVKKFLPIKLNSKNY